MKFGELRAAAAAAVPPSRRSRVERGAGMELVRSGGGPDGRMSSTEKWTTIVAKLCDVVHLAEVAPEKRDANVG